MSLTKFGFLYLNLTNLFFKSVVIFNQSLTKCFYAPKLIIFMPAPKQVLFQPKPNPAVNCAKYFLIAHT